MRLTDYFMDLIAYVTYMVRTAGKKQPPFDQVKADITRLLGQSEDAVRKNVCSPEEYDLARFMICAWIDEMILGSGWQQKGQWQREQLQRIYYNTFEAGEEVFDRLNMVGYQQNNVREIYYLCLSLGFKGKFVRPEDDFLLEQLKASNLKLLFGSSVGLPSLDRGELFPEAYPSETFDVGPQKRPFRFNLFTLTALIGPVALFGLLFLVYWFSLGGIAENLLRTVLQ
jgi:type VI secretion system protein ImpK